MKISKSQKWLIFILMGIFLAIMFGYYSEARAERLTVNLIMASDDLEATIILADLTNRLSRNYGVLISKDSYCIIHIINLKADIDIKYGSARTRLEIMFVSGVILKRNLIEIEGIKFTQDHVVNTFKGSFYYDLDHFEAGMSTLAKVVYHGIVGVYGK